MKSNSNHIAASLWSCGFAIAFVCGLATPAQPHKSDSPFLYVAKDGVDEGACRDPKQPCKTISYAVSKALKGDTILVANGTYRFEPEDPAEAEVLLSYIVPVKGGYSIKDGFSSQSPKTNLTYLIGPLPQYERGLAERGFNLIRKTVDTRTDNRVGQMTQLREPSPGSGSRYVAEEGKDEGTCRDPNRPCRTLQYAKAQAESGDRILMASGTYVLDAESISLLLSEDQPIWGGYSTVDAFAARAPNQNPTYVIGPSPRNRPQLAERGIIIIQDRKGLEIERSIQQPEAVAGEPVVSATPCENGTANIYPCNGIDLLARMPLSQFSSLPARANDIWGFVDLNDNREYAIIGLRNGTAVVDVTNPESPVEVGTIPGNTSIWRDVKVYQFEKDGRWNAYAYVTTDATSQGLHIIDLTNLPTSISLADTYMEFASAHNIYLANTDYQTGQALPGLTPYAYILGSNLDLGAFRILDLSDPTKPVEVTIPPMGTEYIHDATSLVISDARVSDCGPGHNPCELLIDFNGTVVEGGPQPSDNTVDIWDVTDKGSPLQISSTQYTQSRYTHSGWPTEDNLFLFIQDEIDEQDLGINTTLRTLDISNLKEPKLTKVWTGPTEATDHNGFVKKKKYYMSNYRRGLTILDIANPNDPQEIAFF